MWTHTRIAAVVQRLGRDRVVEVLRGRRVDRERRQLAQVGPRVVRRVSSAAARASRSTSGSKRRRSPRSTISASSTSRATSGRPIRRTIFPCPPRAPTGCTTTRSPTRDVARACRARSGCERVEERRRRQEAAVLLQDRHHGRAHSFARHGLQGLVERLVGLGLGVVLRLHVGRDAGALADAAAAEVAPARREVLADGDVERAAVGQPLDLLEDALAVRVRADDRRPLAVLQRAGDDLRRRRRVLVDEHDDRDLARDRAAGRVVDVLGARAALGRDDRARRGGRSRRSATASFNRPPPLSRRSSTMPFGAVWRSACAPRCRRSPCAPEVKLARCTQPIFLPSCGLHLALDDRACRPSRA